MKNLLEIEKTKLEWSDKDLNLEKRVKKLSEIYEKCFQYPMKIKGK